MNTQKEAALAASATFAPNNQTRDRNKSRTKAQDAGSKLWRKRRGERAVQDLRLYKRVGYLGTRNGEYRAFRSIQTLIIQIGQAVKDVPCKLRVIRFFLWLVRMHGSPMKVRERATFYLDTRALEWIDSLLLSRQEIRTAMQKLSTIILHGPVTKSNAVHAAHGRYEKEPHYKNTETGDSFDTAGEYLCDPSTALKKVSGKMAYAGERPGFVILERVPVPVVQNLKGEVIRNYHTGEDNEPHLDAVEWQFSAGFHLILADLHLWQKRYFGKLGTWRKNKQPICIDQNNTDIIKTSETKTTNKYHIMTDRSLLHMGYDFKGPPSRPPSPVKCIPASYAEIDTAVTHMRGLVTRKAVGKPNGRRLEPPHTQSTGGGLAAVHDAHTLSASDDLARLARIRGAIGGGITMSESEDALSILRRA